VLEGPRRATATLVSVLLLAGLLWGVGVALAGDSPSPGASGGQLRVTFGTTDVVDNLNPFLGYTTPSYEIYHLNYDFLVGYDPATPDLAPRPELATSWETSADGKVWTFHLREGVKWQDGEPFTAADVAFTFNYIIDNDLYAYTAFTRSIDSVVAIDPNTVEIRCSEPKANMLRLWIPIVPEHIWSQVPGERAGGDYINKPPIVGTGPFQVVEFKEGSYVKLVKNPYYWNAGKPTIDELVLALYTNADTMTQDLKSGMLAYAAGMPPAQLKTLESEPSLTVDHADQRAFNAIAINCYDSPDSLGNPVLKDPAFREALRWAVDKQKIVDLAYGGYATVGQGLFSTAVPTYYWEPPSDVAVGFDLEKARQALDDAGYTDADGDGVRDYKGKPIALRLWAVTSDVSAQEACKLVAGRFRDIGLKITYTAIDSGALLDSAYNYKGDTFAPDFDMYATTWTYWIDPDYLLNAYTTGQIEGWNDCGWSNAEYDDLYAQQARTIDPAARKPLVDGAQEVFYSQSPYIITSYPQLREAYNTDKWQGWTRVPQASGPVAFLMDNVDTYLNLEPKVATEESGNDRGPLTTLIVIAVIVVVVSLIVAVLLRRRRAAEE
jgi:peptide/nickel transport system substrate-binding protein